MSEFRPLNRAQIAAAFGGRPEMIRAFETLQDLVGGQLQRDIQTLTANMLVLSGRVDDAELEVFARTAATLAAANAYAAAAVESADLTAQVSRLSTQVRELTRRIDTIDEGPL